MRSKSDKKKPLVPRLRFPEFREAGAWEVKELGEIASISNGLTADQSGDSNGLKVTRIETISEGCIDISKVGYIDRIEGVERFGLRIGDILFSHINSQSHIGKTALVEEDFDLYHGMNLLRLQVDKTENNPRFTYYLLNTEFFRKSVQARSNQAVNQASINQTEVGNSQIAVPSAKEQQKIAHCLSSLDEVIGLQAKKVQALKRHKKGLMQQLFPAEGETTTPRLRFPEFREAVAWEVKELIKLAGRGTERNQKGKIKRVLTNSAEHGVLDQREYFDKDIAIQGNLENYFVVDQGDFVYNPRISSFAPVGPISRNDVGKGVMSPLYTVFSFRQSDTDFFAHYFNSSAWHSYMRKVGSTGARHDRMAISNSDFLAMPLSVPNPKEQQKIAHCLSSLDEVIGLESHKLDALKNLKKGLMQQLFPQDVP